MEVRSRTRTYGMTRRVSSPSRSKRNSMKRKLLKRNEMLYLVLRSQPRHGPPDLSDRKGGTALHTMSPSTPLRPMANCYPSSTTLL